MSRSKGFTIIELVVALAVIGILTAIGVPMGLRWKADYRFSMVTRSLSSAVLMARMRGIENRAVVRITASQVINAAPFTGPCPGMRFTTDVDHGLSPPNPPVLNALVVPAAPPAPWNPNFSPVANCRCVKNLGAPPPATPGDMVMISGLNSTRSANGGDFEVLTVPAPNQFTVQHAVSATLDTGGVNNQGTARNVSAPGRLRILPAVHTTGPGPLTDNQENFSGSSDYTIKEEAASIVFRYDAGTAANPGKFEVAFFTGPPPADPLDRPPANTFLDPLDVARNFAEIRFDTRGLPKSILIGNGVPNTNIANITILIAERVPAYIRGSTRQIYYVISPTGKVNTTTAN